MYPFIIYVNNISIYMNLMVTTNQKLTMDTQKVKAFIHGSMVKNLPAKAGDAGLIPGSGRSPEKETATHYHILAWEIPWTEDPGRL